MRKRAPDHVLFNVAKLREHLATFIRCTVTTNHFDKMLGDLMTELLADCKQPHADRFLLEDVYDVKPKKYVRGRLEVSGFGILVFLNGYSDCNTRGGGPVLVENREGIPYVVVWADVNEEEPTHVISLEGARESNRRNDDA